MGCNRCGRIDVPLRRDGECFRCHCQGVGFTFTGPRYGRASFHDETRAEFLAENVGVERIRSGQVERA